MKICFLAPSSYGKSTAVQLLSKHFDIKNIKIGQPLYEMQNNFYNRLGIKIKDKQDGELLQFFGKKVRKENNMFLLNEFKHKLDNTSATIISNDDCRPDDYEFLKDNGFIFIKINGYKRSREDITIANPKEKIEWQSEIPFDYEINNYGTLEEYESELLKLMNKLLSKKCYIIPTQKTCNCDCMFCISKIRNYDKDTEFLKVNDDFIKNIYTLKKHNITRFEITGGGEPFLNRNLEEIVFTIKKIIPNSYIKIYTNGNILKKIPGIDEIDISVVSDDININNKFMNGNNIELIDKLKFFKDENIKLRLSIPLIKGAIDTKEKLDKLINKTKDYVSEYVIRTLYPNTPSIEKMYVDFDYQNEKVIMEKDNDVKEFDGLILWSDNKFYNNWNLNIQKHFNSYLLLKPDSQTYINEIEKLIEEKGFNIAKKLLLSDFKENVLNLYNDKSPEYLEIVKRHLNALSVLFGNNALAFVLDKEGLMDEVYFKTLKLKEDIRNAFSFTHSYGGFIIKDDNISHVNIAHCPEALSNLFDRDLNYLYSLNLKEISEEEFQKIKKYRSYNI